MLVLTLRPKESENRVRLTIDRESLLAMADRLASEGDKVEIDVVLIGVGGGKAKMGFGAPYGVVIDREKVHKRKQQEHSGRPANPEATAEPAAA